MHLPIGVFGDFLSHHILMKEVHVWSWKAQEGKPGFEHTKENRQIYRYIYLMESYIVCKCNSVYCMLFLR